MNMQTILLAACAGLPLGLSCAHAAELNIITSIKNPNSSISLDLADKLFLGKHDEFPDGQKAIPIDLPVGPVRDEFYLKLSGKTRNQTKAYWAKMVFTGAGQSPKELDNPQDLIDLVTNNPNLIAYTDQSKLPPTVKILYTIR